MTRNIPVRAARWGLELAALAFSVSVAMEGACADPPGLVPSDQELARLFAELATGREFERRGRTLRWERPVRYLVMSREPGRVAARAPRVLAEFAAIAGIEAEEAKVAAWSDPAVIPGNAFTTRDGFRGHIERVRGADVDDPPHFVAT